VNGNSIARIRFLNLHAVPRRKKAHDSPKTAAGFLAGFRAAALPAGTNLQATGTTLLHRPASPAPENKKAHDNPKTAVGFLAGIPAGILAGRNQTSGAMNYCSAQKK
jgi:hypothetical protein